MKIRIMGCLLAVLAVSSSLFAQEYKVVIPQLSPGTTATYQSLAGAILEATGAKFSVEVLPFARAVYMVESKNADMLVNEIENPNKAKITGIKFDYASAPLFQLVFVLYSNKSKPVNIEELNKGNPKKLIVESDIAHADFFPFECTGSAQIDFSLKKLDAGRIDAFIFAQPSTDAALKQLGLKNITRTFYGYYTAKILIQKGAAGGPMDMALSKGLEKIKADGTYDKIMKQYLAGASKYNDWQP